MYARGLSVGEIRGHLEEFYGIEVSPDLISAVTDAVPEEVAERQNCPLDAMFPLVFFGAIRVEIRDEGLVRNKAVYIAERGFRPADGIDAELAGGTARARFCVEDAFAVVETSQGCGCVPGRGPIARQC